MWHTYHAFIQIRHDKFTYEMNVRLAARRSLRLAHPRHTRSFFGLFKRKEQRFTEPKPLLSEDNLFHPFSKSPFPAIRARGKAIEQLAPCPVCPSSHEHVHAHTRAQPKAVSFECPDCGWPTHCSEEHWAADQEHQKYCSRLREVNEDEHDLRSGRKLHEFDLPGTTFPIPRYEVSDYLTDWHYRPTGCRDIALIRELGRVLVHPWVPFNEHRTIPATFQQATDIPNDRRLCPSSVQWSDAQQPTADVGRKQVPRW